MVDSNGQKSEEGHCADQPTDEARHQETRISDGCPICERFNEDGAHLLVKSKEVCKIWGILNMQYERERLAECT